MRIISKNTLQSFWEVHANAEQPLKSWYDEVKECSWNTPGDIHDLFPKASIIDNKRVVFDIKGNSYRLVVDIEYKFKTVFVIWIGTHAEYSKINIKELRYVKTHKN